MRKKNGFTLLEMIVVIIIVGILATLGWIHYRGVMEDSMDREAASALKQLQAGQISYQTDWGAYVNSAVLATLNDRLRVHLNTRNWNYRCDDTGCCRAARNPVPGIAVRTWRLRVNDDGSNPGSALRDGEPELGSCP